MEPHGGHSASLTLQWAFVVHFHADTNNAGGRGLLPYSLRTGSMVAESNSRGHDGTAQAAYAHHRGCGTWAAECGRLGRPLMHCYPGL